jgi:hypothetical protein
MKFVLVFVITNTRVLGVIADAIEFVCDQPILAEKLAGYRVGARFGPGQRGSGGTP